MHVGVPYPARFDLPTLWSESYFKLSWRVNCSTPIINYQARQNKFLGGKLFRAIYKYILLQLEFREVPHGDWVEINVPADDYDPSSSSSNSGMGGRYPFAAASVSSSGPMNMGLGGFSVRGRSKGGRGKGGDDDPTLKMHEQSYTLRGLAIGTSYEVIDPLCRIKGRPIVLSSVVLFPGPRPQPQRLRPQRPVRVHRLPHL